MAELITATFNFLPLLYNYVKCQAEYEVQENMSN